MSARRNHRRGGRYTHRVDRSTVLEVARVQAQLYGCRCTWALRTFRHTDGLTYAQVAHDNDCPAANRRGYALTWPDRRPDGPHHGTNEPDTHSKDDPT